ncbi:hypothetical protein BaRGS_00027362 [Batillaria attramentaria]|uniref:C2H2-type domain-containing protein n=1 Tax=Batillaria attramentaria TaxID=370345 RepID=A0ABD0K311_9CAEN
MRPAVCELCAVYLQRLWSERGANNQRVPELAPDGTKTGPSWGTGYLDRQKQVAFDVRCHVTMEDGPCPSIFKIATGTLTSHVYRHSTGTLHSENQRDGCHFSSM